MGRIRFFNWSCIYGMTCVWVCPHVQIPPGVFHHNTRTVPKWYIRILQLGAHTHIHTVLYSLTYDAGYMMMNTYVRRDVVVWDDVRTYCGGGAWDSEREIS